MKFIFPQNYAFKPKLFGFFDYSTAIFNIIIFFFIFLLINFFEIGIKIKLFLFVILYFPILLFTIVGYNGENIIYVFSYIIKYIYRPKIYLFKK